MGNKILHSDLLEILYLTKDWSLRYLVGDLSLGSGSPWKGAHPALPPGSSTHTLKSENASGAMRVSGRPNAYFLNKIMDQEEVQWKEIKVFYSLPFDSLLFIPAV